MDNASNAALAAKQFGRAIGQHLVHVHVALRAGTGLPDRQRKLQLMLAKQHFLGRCDNCRRLVCRQQAQIAIDPRAGRLDGGQRAHDFLGHALTGDGEERD